MKLSSKQFEHYLMNLKIAFEAVFINKIRTFLTALGIIFGVSAVISMLAIGNGAKKEVLEQMKMIGVNNIIIKAKKVDKNTKSAQAGQSEQEKEKESKKNLSAGLSIAEAKSIKYILPTVKEVSVETKDEVDIIYSGAHFKGELSGVNADFFKIFQLKTKEGHFPNRLNYMKSSQVCVIGHGVKSRLFPTVNAIGKQIKCGNNWYKIIGVLAIRGQISGVGASAGIDEFDNTVYIPITSYLKRNNDKSIVTKQKISKRNGADVNPNRNQVDVIVVQVDESKFLRASADLISRMLKRKHAQADDFTISIPELLLKQEQKTRDIFNIVLGAIASISLIVGGIGIMNIMLASVMERTKEIGIRRSIGARASDVVFQFLSEAAIISLFGGFIGVILGVVMASIISKVTDIPTIVSWFSVLVSFIVSAAVGIIFGYMPAKKAADNDIVDSLRYE